MQHLLAGNSGSPPSPEGVIMLVLVLIAAAGGTFALYLSAASRRRQREAPARAAAQAAPVAVSWPVRIQRNSPMDFHGAGMDAGRVALRGEFIEVTHATALGRAFDGREFYFPARQAWLLVQPGVFGRQWLVITGTSSGEPATVAVSPAGGRPALEQLWHSLIAAGARPEQPQPELPVV